MVGGRHTRHAVLSNLRRHAMKALHGLARGDVRALGFFLWGIVCIIDDLDEGQPQPPGGRRMPDDVKEWLGGAGGKDDG